MRHVTIFSQCFTCFMETFMETYFFTSIAFLFSLLLSAITTFLAPQWRPCCLNRNESLSETVKMKNTGCLL